MKRNAKNSISCHISQVLTVVLSISTLLLLGVVTTYTFRSSGEIAQKQAEVIAEKSGRSVQLTVLKVLNQVSASAESFAAGNNQEPLSWSYQSTVMKQLLISNPSYYSAYTYWEGKNFLGSKGIDSTNAALRISSNLTEIWWIRNSTNQLEMIKPTESSSSNPFVQEEWFKTPLRTQKTSLINPYYDDKVRVMMVSATSPIVQNGAAKGLVGVDITLDMMQKMADSVSIFKGKGKLLIASNNQTICAVTGGIGSLKKRLNSSDNPLQKVSDQFPVSESHFESVLSSGSTVSEWWGGNLAVIVPLSFAGNETNWASIVLIPRFSIYGTAIGMTLLLITILVAAGVISIRVLSRIINQSLVNPIENVAMEQMKISEQMIHLTSLTEKIAEGDWSVVIDDLNSTDLIEEVSVGAGREDEIGDLYKSTSKLICANESMRKTLAQMVVQVSGSLDQIREVTDNVASSSREISDSSLALSQTATEQAATVEEINSSTDSLRESASETRLKVLDAQQKGVATMESAESGQKDMKSLVIAMNDIKGSSSAIQKIVKVIDDIAFQTNLLALNAAVEAARAGYHGKGFAVVADEVRNLAGRSAKAAHEISDMIDCNNLKIDAGSSMTLHTSEAFQTIITQIQEMMGVINTVTDATTDQERVIKEISSTLNQVSESVQNVSSTSEETACSGDHLAHQADALKFAVATFKTAKSLQNEREHSSDHTPIDLLATPLYSKVPRKQRSHEPLLKLPEKPKQLQLNNSNYGDY